MTPIVIVGGAGRMGRALVACARDVADLEVRAVVASAGSESLGRDAGELAGIGATGVRIGADLAAALAGARVAIDFSTASAAREHIHACAEAGVALVLGTTGLGDSVDADIARAAERVPVLVAPNTSLGVTLLLDLVRRAAAALPKDFDIEIVESHHRHKVDAPSGTALALGRAAARGRGVELDDVTAKARVGQTGPRAAGEIGFAVMRGGDVVGEHEVRFLAAGEQIALGHRATDRAIFARGALAAASWLAGQGPGRYEMRDVIAVETKA